MAGERELNLWSSWREDRDGCLAWADPGRFGERLARLGSFGDMGCVLDVAGARSTVSAPVGALRAGWVAGPLDEFVLIQSAEVTGSLVGPLRCWFCSSEVSLRFGAHHGFGRTAVTRLTLSLLDFRRLNLAALCGWCADHMWWLHPQLRRLALADYRGRPPADRPDLRFPLVESEVC